jgi:hypothetical protein
MLLAIKQTTLPENSKNLALVTWQSGGFFTLEEGVSGGLDGWGCGPAGDPFAGPLLVAAPSNSSLTARRNATRSTPHNNRFKLAQFESFRNL